MCQPRWRFVGARDACQGAINRQRSRPADHQERHHRDEHVDPDTKCRNAGEASQDEPQPAEELRCDRQECERSWHVHHAREHRHRGGEAETTKPPRHFLCTVCEEDHPQHQPKDRCRDAVICGTYCANHSLLLRCHWITRSSQRARMVALLPSIYSLLSLFPRDPLTDIRGTMEDGNTCSLTTAEEAHHLDIHQRHLVEV